MNEDDFQNLTPDQQQQLMLRFGGQGVPKQQGPQYSNQNTVGQPALGQASQDQTKQALSGSGQSSGGMPQGQMVGNIYVPPAATQTLAAGLRNLGSDKLKQIGTNIGNVGGQVYDNIFGG